MNHSHRTSTDTASLSETATAAPIQHTGVPADVGTSTTGQHRVRGLRNCHRGPTRPNAKPGLVEPPRFLTAFCWFFFCRQPRLGLFLKTCGSTTARLASLFKLSGETEVLAGAASRTNSTWGLRRRGARTTAFDQTQQNRELGQLCQTQKWLKRYKTGMFANLAMLANVFSQNRPPTTSGHRGLDGNRLTRRSDEFRRRPTLCGSCTG